MGRENQDEELNRNPKYQKTTIDGWAWARTGKNVKAEEWAQKQQGCGGKAKDITAGLSKTAACDKAHNSHLSVLHVPPGVVAAAAAAYWFHSQHPAYHEHHNHRHNHNNNNISLLLCWHSPPGLTNHKMKLSGFIRTTRVFWMSPTRRRDWKKQRYQAMLSPPSWMSQMPPCIAIRSKLFGTVGQLYLQL